MNVFTAPAGASWLSTFSAETVSNLKPGSNLTINQTMESPMNRTPKLTPEQPAYENWYDQQVRMGLEDIEAGRVVAMKIS